MPLIINGEAVDDAVIRAESSALRPRYEEMIQGQDPVEMEMQLRDWSRENVIERVLLRQEAFKEQSPIPPGLDPEAEAQYRLQSLIEKITGKAPRPKHKEIADYYRKNKEQFRTPEMIRASHIVKNVDENTSEERAQEAIEKVREELKNGASFLELADRHSDCPGSGGDLGYFAPGQMVEEFDKVVFALKPGETSDIFRTVFGFHIARVNDHKPAGIRSLPEVHEEIEQALSRDRQERAMEDFVDGLKAKAVIQNVRGK